MAYTALYRKYRPDTFSGLIGQEHIVRTLKNQMKTGRISHAYLFCGTRGTGKTSTAKIFARAINCLSPTADGEPCNCCSVCENIKRGRSVDVVEIDAASNNSVDNVREIREEVKYPPTEGKYKVYIIDEVHMLSNSAFNALLKTLEEPPAHCIFILATTDPQKVPATILSRCQRFDFRRIRTAEIAQALGELLQKESIAAAPEALRYVATLGDGSMRDSLSILDQCISFYSGEEITLEKVLDITGSVDRSIFFQMVDALAKKDAKTAMSLVEEMMESGRDVKQFLSELIAHLRDLLVAGSVSAPAEILDVSPETIEKLQEQMHRISIDEVIYLVRVFSDLQNEMRYASNERILLEVTLLKLCAGQTEQNLGALAARLAGLERKIAEGIPAAVTAASDQTETAPVKKAVPKRKPPALEGDRKTARDEWPMMRSDVEDTILRSLLTQVEVGFLEDEYLYLVCAYDALEEMIQPHLDTIEKLLERHVGKSFLLKTTTKERYDNWRKENYDEEVQEQEDAEFASLMGSYFPDADFE